MPPADVSRAKKHFYQEFSMTQKRLPTREGSLALDPSSKHIQGLEPCHGPELTVGSDDMLRRAHSGEALSCGPTTALGLALVGILKSLWSRLSFESRRSSSHSRSRLFAGVSSSNRFGNGH